jgi:hypothetical protein
MQQVSIIGNENYEQNFVDKSKTLIASEINNGETVR